MALKFEIDRPLDGPTVNVARAEVARALVVYRAALIVTMLFLGAWVPVYWEPLKSSMGELIGPATIPGHEALSILAAFWLVVAALFAGAFLCMNVYAIVLGYSVGCGDLQQLNRKLKPLSAAKALDALGLTKRHPTLEAYRQQVVATRVMLQGDLDVMQAWADEANKADEAEIAAHVCAAIALRREAALQALNTPGPTETSRAGSPAAPQ